MARGDTADMTMRHLSGMWRVRAIRTHATEVARGVQSVKGGACILGSVSERLESCCCFFQFMRSPNLGATHTETV